MLWIVVGILAAFNWLIIIKKYKLERYADVTLDIGFMLAFTWLFGDTGQGGMVVAMVSSTIVSLSLLRSPLPIDMDDESEKSTHNEPSLPKEWAN